MATNVAEDNLSDVLVGTMHANAIDLLRFEAGERARILALLDDLEADLLVNIRKAIGKGDLLTATRLNGLLAQTRDTIATAYGDVSQSNLKNLGLVSQATALSVVNAVNDFIGIDITSVSMTAGQLKDLANETYFMGRYVEEYWNQQGENLYNKFTTEMRLGMLQGEGIRELTTRVTGTKELNFADGLMNIPRYQAEALVRTGTVGAANAGRTATYLQNADVLNGIEWVATLDDRVCEECAALDGTVWDLPESGDPEDYGGFTNEDDVEYPGPIEHVSCRCAQIPVVKSYDQLREEGELGKSDLAKIDDDTAAAMDGEPTSYGFEDWLNDQPKDVQDEVLGETAADLWREGKMDIADLTDQSNRPLTAEELLDKYG